MTPETPQQMLERLKRIAVQANTATPARHRAIAMSDTDAAALSEAIRRWELFEGLVEALKKLCERAIRGEHFAHAYDVWRGTLALLDEIAALRADNDALATALSKEQAECGRLLNERVVLQRDSDELAACLEEVLHHAGLRPQHESIRVKAAELLRKRGG